MPLSYGLRELPDPYLLFEKQTTFDEVNLEPKCKFYACDYINQNEANMPLDGVGIGYLSRLTIKALIKPEIAVNVDDIVESLKTGDKWRVTNIEIQDDNQMKRNSLSVRQYLILTLVK